MQNEKIVVLIPAYNPTEDLIPLVNSLLNNEFIVVIVNDGSLERTKYIFDKLDKERITLLVHDINKGKGQALKTGLEYIYNNLPCRGVITADADGQHIIDDIIKISETLKENDNCLILGSRFDTDSMPLGSKFGNRITRFVFKLATNKKVYDTQTGLRGIPFNYIKDFCSIPGQRYEYEINMLIYAIKKKIDIKEIGIHSIYIDNNKASSFHPFRDSCKIYKCIFKYSHLKITLPFIITIIILLIIILLIFIQ